MLNEICDVQEIRRRRSKRADEARPRLVERHEYGKRDELMASAFVGTRETKQVQVHEVGRDQRAAG